MGAARSPARRVLSILLICATGGAVAACVTINPGGPPTVGPQTSTDTAAETPAEYTGPDVEAGVPQPATPEVRSPEYGSAERKAILNAVRKPVEKELEQDVIFKVLAIRVSGEWAYVRAKPLTPGGKEIDYSDTSFREQVDAGAFDDAVDALVKNAGGEWRTVDYVIGATDVAWSPWPEHYGAPEAIFTSQ